LFNVLVGRDVIDRAAATIAAGSARQPHFAPDGPARQTNQKSVAFSTAGAKSSSLKRQLGGFGDAGVESIE